MDVVLLERVAKLGQMGEVVSVKQGYARNFLLPRGKALRATEANMQRFEGQRAQLEARNLELKAEAEGVSAKLDGQTFVVIRSASDGGGLYGSVTTRDAADAATEAGFSLDRRQVVLQNPIKELGPSSCSRRFRADTGCRRECVRADEQSTAKSSESKRRVWNRCAAADVCQRKFPAISRRFPHVST